MTNIVEVYRLEIEVDGKKVGPFVASVGLKDNPTLTKLCNRFRNGLRSCYDEPNEDGADRHFHYGHVCGAESIQQMSLWMPDRWTAEAMLGGGFELNVYEIDEEKLGKCRTQVFWSPADAKLKHSLTWNEYLDLFYGSRRKPKFFAQLGRSLRA